MVKNGQQFISLLQIYLLVTSVNLIHEHLISLSLTYLLRLSKH